MLEQEQRGQYVPGHGLHDNVESYRLLDRTLQWVRAQQHDEQRRNQYGNQPLVDPVSGAVELQPQPLYSGYYSSAQNGEPHGFEGIAHRATEVSQGYGGHWATVSRIENPDPDNQSMADADGIQANIHEAVQGNGTSGSLRGQSPEGSHMDDLTGDDESEMSEEE
ncbi:hypothetical protein OQA88_2656 [Cercophora sp. LCS_1]